jgi:hypothetical protein
MDIVQKQNSGYFQEYLKSRGFEDRMKAYWGTDQSDSKKIRQIISREYSGPLDLVIDDASHSYELTKASFETLFLHLRPGGLYIIEDWAWAHWEEFQAPDHPWSKETPLTQLVFELVEAVGTGRARPGSPPLIANVNVFQGLAVVERGGLDQPEPPKFVLDDYISRRPNGL